MDFTAVYDHVRDATGLTFPQIRLEAIRAIFTSAMTARRIASPVELVSEMKRDAVLRDEIVAALTIGETYFFRDPAQFDVVREIVMPSLLREKTPSSPIRIWSAASASGEEPYTLAIILEELGLEQRANVTGTDISRPRLETAQRACYKKWSLRGVSESTIARYFVQKKDTYELTPRIRERVQFKYLNLAEDTYPSLGLGIYDMDLIMCRNVLIYFDEVTVSRVAQRLLDSLSETGWLLLGASDPPISQLVECDVVTTAAGLAYRRPGAGGSAAVHSRPQDYAYAAAEPVFVYEPVGVALEAVAPASPGMLPVLEPEPSVTAPATSVSAEAEDAGRSAVLRTVRALCNTGHTREAASVAMRGLDAHGDAAELHYLLAVALAHENENEEGIRAVKRALYLDRDLVIAHVLAGQLYTRTGDVLSARRSFRNAATLLQDLDADAIVTGTDGERVGRIREVVAVQLRLLQEAA